MTSSAVNSSHESNIIMPISLAMDREIQGFSFIVWCVVEIMHVN